MTPNDRVRQIRKQNKLSLREMGEKIGMSGPNVSRIENGERVVTDRTVKLLCNEFGICPEWLRTGEGSKYPVMTQDEEFATIVAKMLANDDDISKRIVMKVSKLSDEQKLMIDNMLTGLI